jgi:hypothetical protein
LAGDWSISVATRRIPTRAGFWSASRRTPRHAATPADDYALDDDILTFTSQIESPWPENNRAYGQFFPGPRSNKKPGAAVVVLAQWNAKWHEQQGVCRWLNRLGITAVKLSLPYHDRRAIPDHPRADHLVGPNIGLTLQANRQAVLDLRRTLRWLAMQGYERLGLIGTSIGPRSRLSPCAMSRRSAPERSCTCPLILDRWWPTA